MSDTHLDDGADTVGGRLGAYVIEGILGRGGMGIVYRARHEPSGRVYAIKTVVRNSDPSLEDRLRREALLLARLDDPGIVPVLDVGATGDGRFYLVMDLVAGESLQSRVPRLGGPSVRAHAAAVAAAARALHHAHGHGILHRDLKPANVLIDQAGRARLLDFGLGKVVDRAVVEELTRTGMAIGTLEYMGPEQIDGASVATVASDVYGLGATLYYAIAGTSPFAGASAARLIATIITHVPDPPSRCSNLGAREHLGDRVADALDAACLWALAKDPSERPPSAIALADAIERAIVAEDPSTLLAPPRRSAPPPPPAAAPAPGFAPAPPRGDSTDARREPPSGSARLDSRRTPERDGARLPVALLIAVSAAVCVVGAVAFVAVRQPASGVSPAPIDPTPPETDELAIIRTRLADLAGGGRLAEGCRALAALGASSPEELDARLARREPGLARDLLAWLALERAAAGDADAGRRARELAIERGAVEHAPILAIAVEVDRAIESCVTGRPDEARRALERTSTTNVLGEDAVALLELALDARRLIGALLGADPVTIDGRAVDEAFRRQLRRGRDLEERATRLRAGLEDRSAVVSEPLARRVEAVIDAVGAALAALVGHGALRVDAGDPLVAWALAPTPEDGAWRVVRGEGIGLRADLDPSWRDRFVAGEVGLVLRDVGDWSMVDLLLDAGEDRARAETTVRQGGSVIERADAFQGGRPGQRDRATLWDATGSGFAGQDLLVRLRCSTEAGGLYTLQAAYARTTESWVPDGYDFTRAFKWASLRGISLEVRPAPATMIRALTFWRVGDPRDVTPAPGARLAATHIDRSEDDLDGAWSNQTDGSRALVEPGHAIEASFTVEEDAERVSLVLTHATGRYVWRDRRYIGYAPITLRVNGQVVVRELSPLTRAFRADAFDVTDLVEPGENRLRIEPESGGRPRTSYLIRRIEVRRRLPSR